MILANNIKNILNEFDFTDSIVTNVRLSDNLLDLELILNYYWDIQEGKEECRDLQITFKRYCNVKFHIDKELITNTGTEQQGQNYSWFTIVRFEEPEDKRINIYTTDYSIPWLSLDYGEIILEEL